MRSINKKGEKLTTLIIQTLSLAFTYIKVFIWQRYHNYHVDYYIHTTAKSKIFFA